MPLTAASCPRHTASVARSAAAATPVSAAGSRSCRTASATGSTVAPTVVPVSAPVSASAAALTRLYQEARALPYHAHIERRENLYLELAALAAVTGQMRSDRSGSVCRLAGCNYGGSGGRVLIMAAMVAARLN